MYKNSKNMLFAIVLLSIAGVPVANAMESAPVSEIQAISESQPLGWYAFARNKASEYAGSVSGYAGSVKDYVIGHPKLSIGAAGLAATGAAAVVYNKYAVVRNKTNEGLQFAKRNAVKLGAVTATAALALLGKKAYDSEDLNIREKSAEAWESFKNDRRQQVVVGGGLLAGAAYLGYRLYNSKKATVKPVVAQELPEVKEEPKWKLELTELLGTITDAQYNACSDLLNLFDLGFEDPTLFKDNKDITAILNDEQNAAFSGVLRLYIAENAQ